MFLGFLAKKIHLSLSAKPECFRCWLSGVIRHQPCPHPLPLAVFVIIFLFVIRLGRQSPLGSGEVAQTCLGCQEFRQAGP